MASKSFINENSKNKMQEIDIYLEEKLGKININSSNQLLDSLLKINAIDPMNYR